jgi:hypothetical protein
VDFTLKIYPKYQYQPVSIRLKEAEREAFIKAINNKVFNYLYNLYPLRKRNYYYFYSKKNN